MEGIAPTLKCLIEIQSAMLNGESIRSGLIAYLQGRPRSDDCASEVRRFFFLWEQGQDWKVVARRVKSPARRALFDLIACGLAGQSVLPQLEELREEIVAASHDEIRHNLEMLPLKMLLPLLLFQFPAFLLLLFGPLLRKLVEEMSR